MDSIRIKPQAPTWKTIALKAKDTAANKDQLGISSNQGQAQPPKADPRRLGTERPRIIAAPEPESKASQKMTKNIDKML